MSAICSKNYTNTYKIHCTLLKLCVKIAEKNVNFEGRKIKIKVENRLIYYLNKRF